MRPLMKVTVTAGLDRGLVLQLASYFSTFVPYINSYTYHDWHDCYLWSEGLGYWFYLASDKSVWACQHSSTACIQLVWDYRITGNFSWCKISQKCCICYRRNFCNSYFWVSRVWQLTTPLNVNEKLTRLPTFLRQGISSLRIVAQICL